MKNIKDLNKNKYKNKYICDYLNISENLLMKWKREGFGKISLKNAWGLKQLYNLTQDEFEKCFDLRNENNL